MAMMLIDKIALEDDLCSDRPEGIFKFTAAQAEAARQVVIYMRNCIQRAPIVDAVPVVHGRWEPSTEHKGYLCCSVCHDVYILQEWITDKKWPYCQNCGAKMDLKEEEHADGT